MQKVAPFFLSQVHRRDLEVKFEHVGFVFDFVLHTYKNGIFATNNR